jgi:hypothetical protein
MDPPALGPEFVVGICGFISFASSTVNKTLCKAFEKTKNGIMCEINL